MKTINKPSLKMTLALALLVGFTPYTSGEACDCIFELYPENPWADSDIFHNRVDADRKRRQTNKEHRHRLPLGGGGGGSEPKPKPKPNSEVIL